MLLPPLPMSLMGRRSELEETALLHSTWNRFPATRTERFGPLQDEGSPELTLMHLFSCNSAVTIVSVVLYLLALLKD